MTALLRAATQHHQTAISTVLAIVTAITIVVVHRLFLHPLAALRGPFFARISSWPNWYHAAKGDRHIWLLRLHSKHGSTVRFGPSSVSFNTPSAFESIYASRDASLRKGDWYQCVKDTAGGFESTFTARDRSRHALKRRILAHAFSERALREYEPRIRAMSTRWVNSLAAEASDGDGGSVDFAAWANYIIFDILGDLCYGKDFGLVHSTKNRYVTKLLPRTTRSWYMLGYHPWSHLLRYLLFKTSLKTSLGRIFVRTNSTFREFCVASLMERIKVEKTPEKGTPVSKDMFHHLLRARDPETGEGFSMGDLGAESVLLMIAGTHTTSVAIAAIVFYLASNAEKLNKLAAEIRTEFSSTEDMTYQRLVGLPFLRSCINESLRLCPPTAGHLQREALGAGVDIGGFLYPAGTNVGISAYAFQRNPLLWPQPDDFLPERWLQNDSADMQKSQPGLIAFSSGPLGCPGKQLAYMEMSIIVAMLVHRYDVTLDKSESSDKDYTIKDCYVGQASGPRIFLRSK
ncbi:cytochrome P450 [Polyplosphaeria fusca]|uniref:Cytochrome P450 n=1 Tax=Polyplosphaeria fusca TaxID=682080 RepID=A0A9P4R134_9PLEO|nr:cytochrome P450 [Polyplosphaeria fusca]